MAHSKAIRVLYMEDDRGLARLVQRRLQKAGYSIDIAYDGKKGLEMYQAHSYDIVAVDQSIPEYEGLKVINELASRGQLPVTIMITGTGDENLAVEAMKLGAKDYIIKDSDGKFLELLPYVIDRALFSNHLEKGKTRAVQALRESEERFHTLFELACDPFLTLMLPYGGISDVNGAAERLLGYAKEELKKLTIWQLFAPEIAEDAYLEWKKQTKEKGYFVMESMWLRSDGLHVPVTLSGRPIKLRGKTQFFIIAHDITKLKIRERSLFESEQKYQSLIKNLHVGIWAIDKEGFTSFVNPYLADMLGYTEDEMKGRHLFSFMDKQGMRVCKHHLEQRKKGIKERHDLEFLRKDEKRIHVNIETSPVFDAHGQYIGAVIGVVDVTDRKKETEALVSRNAHLEYLLRSGPAIIYSCRAHGNHAITRITDNVSSRLGYTSEELLSDPDFWVNHIHPEDIPEVLEGFKEILKKGHAICEYRFLHKNGTYLRVHSESNMAEGTDGNLGEIIGCITGIME